MREVWPACLTAGVSFGITQYYVSNHFGPSLVDIAGSIVSILSLLVLLRFWQPRTTWSFEHESDAERAAEAAARPAHTRGRTFRALVPWLLLCVFVFVWGYPASKDFLNGGTEGHENFLHGISPDGSTLGFVRIDGTGGPGRLALIASAGGRVTVVDTGAGHVDGPDWSPDGRWIYFNTERWASRTLSSRWAACSWACRKPTTASSASRPAFSTFCWYW